MTSLQLLQRLLRHTTSPEISVAPGDLLLCALEKINEALTEIYTDLPPIYRESEEGYEIRAPEIVTYNTIAGAHGVTGITFAAHQIGCSVLEAGATRPNAIVSETRLLMPATRTATGAAATIYYDSIQLDRDIESLVSDPRLIDLIGPSTTDIVLRRWERHTYPHVPWTTLGFGGSLTQDLASHVGRPWLYRIQSNRASRPRAQTTAPEAAAWIHVYPWPQKAYRMTLDAIWSPLLLTFADLRAPRVLPALDRHAQAFLGALCESKMIATRYWDGGRELADAVRDEAARARRVLLQQASDWGVPRATVGTAPGY